MDTRKQAVLIAVFLQLISLHLVHLEDSPGCTQQDGEYINFGEYEAPTSFGLSHYEDDEPKVHHLPDYDDSKYDISNDKESDEEYSSGRNERSPANTQIRVPHDYKRIKRSLNLELQGRDIPRNKIVEIQEIDEEHSLSREERSPRNTRIRVPHDYNRIKRSLNLELEDLPRNEISEAQETNEEYSITREERSPRNTQFRVPHDYKRIKRSSRVGFGRYGYNSAEGYAPNWQNRAQVPSGGNGRPFDYSQAFAGQAALASAANFGGFKPVASPNLGEFYKPVGGNYGKEPFIGYGGTGYPGSNYYGKGMYPKEWDSNSGNNRGLSQREFSGDALQSGGNQHIFLPRNKQYLPSN